MFLPGRKRDEEAQRTPGHAGPRNGRKEPDTQLGHQQRRGVGTEAKVGGVRDLQQPCVPDQQVQRSGHHEVDLKQDEQV